MRSALNGVVAAVALACLTLSTGSCSSCEAKCVGPQVEISVSADVSEVTVCTDAGSCTTQAFGPVEDGTIGRSFTVIATASDGKVPVTVSGKSVDGKSIEPTRLLPKTSAGNCGCAGPARAFIDLAGAHLYTDG